MACVEKLWDIGFRTPSSASLAADMALRKIWNFDKRIIVCWWPEYHGMAVDNIWDCYLLRGRCRQRSARILDPGNSRRESASFFLARPREMIFWSLDLVSKHESNKMESRSRLEIREWSYDNLDLVSPGEGKKNDSRSCLEKLHLPSGWEPLEEEGASGQEADIDKEEIEIPQNRWAMCSSAKEFFFM